VVGGKAVVLVMARVVSIRPPKTATAVVTTEPAVSVRVIWKATAWIWLLVGAGMVVGWTVTDVKGVAPAAA
jgi:hypothetical protein